MRDSGDISEYVSEKLPDFNKHSSLVSLSLNCFVWETLLLSPNTFWNAKKGCYRPTRNPLAIIKSFVVKGCSKWKKDIVNLEKVSVGLLSA